MRFLVLKGILCVAFSVGSSFHATSQAPPIVQITSPTNTATFNGGSLQIAVTVQPTGRVSWITFFAGTNRLGHDFTEPFSFTWTNPLAGRHALTALAIVTGGLYVESDPV